MPCTQDISKVAINGLLGVTYTDKVLNATEHKQSDSSITITGEVDRVVSSFPQAFAETFLLTNQFLSTPAFPKTLPRSSRTASPASTWCEITSRTPSSGTPGSRRQRLWVTSRQMTTTNTWYALKLEQ